MNTMKERQAKLQETLQALELDLLDHYDEETGLPNAPNNPVYTALVKKQKQVLELLKNLNETIKTLAPPTQTSDNVIANHHKAVMGLMQTCPSDCSLTRTKYVLEFMEKFVNFAT